MKDTGRESCVERTMDKGKIERERREEERERGEGESEREGWELGREERSD